MTTIEAPPREITPVRWNRTLLTLAAASALLAVVAGIGLLVDDRVLTGMPIWAKPFKFAVSFAVYAWTLAWMLAVLPRRSRPAELAGIVIGGVSVIELSVIVLQVARGTTSHYNVATPFDTALWVAMSVSIMVLFGAHLLVGIAALRQRMPDRAAASAIRWGLFVALLGMGLAFLMTSQGGVDGMVGAHSVGVPDGGPGMPVTGWSTTGGDLRIGHFVGLHALQALPILAYALRRWSTVTEVVRARLVLVAGSAYGVLVLLLTWQALRAQPLLRPDGLTWAAVAGLLAATAAATFAVTRKP